MEKYLLKDELRQLFYVLNKQGAFIYKLKETAKEYEAYFINEENWRGVAIPTNNRSLIEKDYLANFENIKVTILTRQIRENETINFLCLLTKNNISIDKFILLCIDFIEPGVNGENRKELLENPQSWVNRWKKLMGNKSENDMDYSFLGELIILDYLLDREKDVKITDKGTYDIETKEKNCEVKTTIMRYTSTIEVHSQYQFKQLNNNPLELYFVRLEETMQGVSINSIIKSIENKKFIIEGILNKINDISTESREKQYNVLEIRKYLVDDKFPKITSESFKGDCIPEKIINIKYVIDLDGLEYENIKI